MTKSAGTMEVNPLVGKLTLEEKIQLLSGFDLWRSGGSNRSKGLGYIKLTDGPNGARGGGGFKDSVPAALFPCPSCLGATFDRELAERMGKGIAEDSLSKHCHVSLAPTVNIQRDPRGGRWFESYSEDPVLSGELGHAWIKGCQGCGVGSTPKHFVANEAETYRRLSDSIMDQEALREIYLLPFQRLLRNLARDHSRGEEASPKAGVFRGQPACIMTAYNKLNGISCSENQELLQRILRGEWGFKGLIMSDWFGTYSTVQAIKAGLNLEMPGPTAFRKPEQIALALEEGRLELQEIDRLIQPLVETVEKCTPLGVGHDVASEPQEEDKRSEEISRSIRTIGSEGAVLLRNELGLLPLRLDGKVKRILLVGEPAIKPIQSGGGSAWLKPQYWTKPLDSIREALDENGGESIQLSWCKGCNLFKQPPPLTSEVLVSSWDPRGGEGGGDGQVKIEWFQREDDMESDPTPFATTFQTNSILELFDGPRTIPQGLGDGFKCKVQLRFSPKTSGEHALGFSAYGGGNLKVWRIDEGDAKVEMIKNWEYRGADDAFEYILATQNFCQLEEIPMEVGQVFELELVYESPNLPPAMGEGPMGSFRIGLEETRSDRILIQEAVSKAEESDLVLVLTATGPEWETEGMDRKDLKLPRQQESLLERLSRAHQEKVVVFNLTGAPVEMDWALDRRLQAELLGKEEEDCFTIPTVVQMWFPGQEGGRAMADVLLGLGQAPASGRMSSTWPLRIQDHASYSEDSSSFPGTILRSTSSGGSGTSPTSVRVDYKEGKYTGYNHYLSSRSERRPLFWFGQGLGGYTRFQQRLVGTSGELTPSPGSQVVVEVEVENLGERGGKEVIQIYSILPCSAKDRGYTKLAAFETVRLQAKERKVVRLKLEQESFSSWQEQAKPDGWKVDKGKYTFSLSRSSDPDSEIERFTVEVGQSWRWGGLGHLE